MSKLYTLALEAAGALGVGLVICGVAQLSHAAATILSGLVIVGVVVMLVRQR